MVSLNQGDQVLHGVLQSDRAKVMWKHVPGHGNTFSLSDCTYVGNKWINQKHLR